MPELRRVVRRIGLDRVRSRRERATAMNLGDSELESLLDFVRRQSTFRQQLADMTDEPEQGV